MYSITKYRNLYMNEKSLLNAHQPIMNQLDPAFCVVIPGSQAVARDSGEGDLLRWCPSNAVCFFHRFFGTWLSTELMDECGYPNIYGYVYLHKCIYFCKYVWIIRFFMHTRHSFCAFAVAKNSRVPCVYVHLGYSTAVGEKYHVLSGENHPFL